MWNKTGKLILSDFLLSLLCCWTLLPNTCSSIPLPSQSQSNPSAVSFTTNQWQSLMRDAIQFLQKHQKNQQRQEQQQEVLDHKPSIRFMVDPSYSGAGSPGGSSNGGGTGLVKLRNIRSGFGDMQNVVRLVQLHELEKEWASKARPRFGKRAEVTQDNFLPPYAYRTDGDYDHEADSKVSMLPEDYAQYDGNRQGEPQRFLRYSARYFVPGV